MLLQRSILAAAPAERPRLAPPWSIILLGSMTLAVLVGIYPHQTLVNRLYQAPPGEITNAYLVNLLRTDPKNPRLRLMLARNQILAGQFSQVTQTIAPALASNVDSLYLEATWLLWLSEEHRYLLLPPDAPQRETLREYLRNELFRLADLRWEESMLVEIARKSLALGDTQLGLKLFHRLASEYPNRDENWFSEGARAALENGEYLAAAEFYLIASERGKSIAAQRRFFIEAMRTLESGNRIPEALKLAEVAFQKTPALSDDMEVLVLLVQFARAARRPDLADKYARRLLRLSMLEQWQREQRVADGFDVTIRRVALAGDEPDRNLGKGPQLPFDDKIYTLGFEAFLDNRKLEDAWKVAASAVRQAPDNLVWRERLAKVSEWTGRPQQGLENWLYLARAGGRDDAWQAVLRLAPGLFDDTALQAAIQYELSRQPGKESLLRELVAIYERLGDPAGALRVLEKTYAQTHQPWALEYMAQLAERAADEDLALRYWRQLIADDGLTTTRAVRVATLLLLRGQGDEGLALLEQAGATASGNDIPFWRLTAEIAQFVQKDSTAINAYRRFVGQPEAEVHDFDALFELLQLDYPLEAAHVAAKAWSNFHQTKHLTQALGLYATRERWLEMGVLFASLDAKQRRLMRQHPDFLILSAQYYLNTGKLELARRDLEAAVQLATGAPDTQLALLWLLIDIGDPVGLRRALAAWEGGWRENPALHDALGSAYLALSLPDIALRRYYTPHLAEHRNDFLWLMNYADALEQNQDVDRAWQLRQHLLAQERQRSGRKDWLSGLDASETRDLRRAARARLVIAQRQGDPGLSVLRELLRLDRDADKKLSSASKDVALGWLQDAGQYQAERGWLWQQYAQTAARPLWAEISLALAENDREAAGQLLDRYGERLPRYDRINAARLVDDVRLAQSDAFDTQTLQPFDDPLHLQLTEALLAHSDHIGVGLTGGDIGSVKERNKSALWHLAISPRLSLDLTLGSIDRNNDDTKVIGYTPDESVAGLRANWRHPDGETTLVAEERNSYDAYHPLMLQHEQRINERMSFNLMLGSQLPSTESTTLRVAGMKDAAALALRYRPTARDQLALTRSWDRFNAQEDGKKLGSGQSWQVEAAHAFRIEPRDLEGSVFWSTHNFSQVPMANLQNTQMLAFPPGTRRSLVPSDAETIDDIASDFFVPNDFRYYGVRLSTNTRFEREYTRAWRPYASVARTWNTSSGPGYDVSAGIAGSVFGGDHLNFGIHYDKAGSTSDGTVRVIGFTYRLHY